MNDGGKNETLLIYILWMGVWCACSGGIECVVYTPFCFVLFCEWIGRSFLLRGRR